jgi:dihydrodipicolinate synthase/N-acetylneuraminate lyase
MTPAITGPRRITGMAAVLLPYLAEGEIDWPAFEAHVVRTSEAGLVVAANMDTGYVQLLADDDRRQVLDTVADVCPDGFVAGAYVADEPGAPFDLDAYVRAAVDICARGGTPVVFPSHGLNGLDDDGWVEALDRFGQHVDRFIGFELGPMFVPYGRIVGIDAYRGLLAIRACIGAKHSSLSRAAEWERLAVRDEVRPDFQVLTGNDRAIDMVMWGSDYLLGLATFAPAEFARRDAYWEVGDPRFFELTDVLQSLGSFAFRAAVPAYRHDAAMFLQMRGWASADGTPAGAPRRPESDRAVLAGILEQLETR